MSEYVGGSELATHTPIEDKRSPNTWQNVAGNFDLVSNMLPEIEGCYFWQHAA